MWLFTGILMYHTPKSSHCIHEFPSHVDIGHCAALWQQYRDESIDKQQEVSGIYPVWTSFTCQSSAKPTRNREKNFISSNQEALWRLSTALQFCFFEELFPSFSINKSLFWRGDLTNCLAASRGFCSKTLLFYIGTFPYMHIWLHAFILDIIFKL